MDSEYTQRTREQLKGRFVPVLEVINTVEYWFSNTKTNEKN